MRLTFTGDIIIELPQFQKIGNGDYSTIFSEVKPIFEKTDLLIGNLETPLAGEEAGYTNHKWSFNSPDNLAVALKQVGFNILTTANNHCLDRGIPGLVRTLDKLDQVGIQHIGTFRRPSEKRHLNIQVEGKSVALLSCTYGTNSAFNRQMLSEDNEYMVSLTEKQTPPCELIKRWNIPMRAYNKIRNKLRFLNFGNKHAVHNKSLLHRIKTDIGNAKNEGADFIIMCLHYGGQYNDMPTEDTCKMVNWMFENGIDLVVANHEHVIHPIERRKDGRIAAYCLGNLTASPNSQVAAENASAQINKTDYSLVLHLDFNLDWTYPTISYEIIKSVIDNDGISRIKTVDTNDKNQEWLINKVESKL